MSLAKTRCFQHADREAAARCPECERFYCRECVTEHDGRMICRTCLEILQREFEAEKKGTLSEAWAWLLAFGGYVLASYVFYQMGRFLLRIPSEFHSGTLFE